jgi:hypothetical protein
MIEPGRYETYDLKDVIITYLNLLNSSVEQLIILDSKSQIHYYNIIQLYVTIGFQVTNIVEIFEIINRTSGKIQKNIQLSLEFKKLIDMLGGHFDARASMIRNEEILSNQNEDISSTNFNKIKNMFVIKRGYNSFSKKETESIEFDLLPNLTIGKN